MSVKQKILNYLSKPTGQNTLTVAQARARFGVANVSARISELRKEGHKIETLTKKSSGRTVSYYGLAQKSSKKASKR